MLLALVICHLSVFVAANPFHKYPFVFLLDVGNEELEKANSEQIRISVPGGSVALRYPATGDGNTIGHVRVSGIDFGTDLKANIVDGGPGYKYVVLVFMGNPDTPYDAVVTVQTVIDDIAFNTQNLGSVVNSESNDNQNIEDENNSAEDLSGDDINNNIKSETFVQNSNAELMQSSSNVYSYVDGELMDEDEDDDDSSESENDSDSDNAVASNEVYSDDFANAPDGGVSNEKDIHEQYSDDIDQEDIDVKDTDVEDGEDDDQEMSSKGELDYSDSNTAIDESDSYSKYESFPGQEYSQEELQKNSGPAYQEDPLDYEDPYAEGPVYDDDDVANGVNKYRDSNKNNYIDADDSYAVPY